MRKRSFGVILSGCGHRDGAEIHEATLTLLAIHRHGAEYRCFAPDMMQAQVIDHITGKEMLEKRNVLVEAARIARGKIRALAEFNPDELDGLVIPGGLGAAKNLSTYFSDGVNCTVQQEVFRAIEVMAFQGKPIGALCIAPVILAKVLGAKSLNLTIGHDPGTASDLEKMGAVHKESGHGEVVVDRKNRIVTTPCYMLDARVDQIADGADRVIAAMLEMM